MTGRRLPRSVDHYAAFRCLCRHLVYADDEPGGSCRFCDCTAHEAPAQAASGKAAAK